MLTDPHTIFSSPCLSRLESLLARRANREPLAYLLGRKEFWGLELEVTPGVLVPRPDTETVVEAVLAQSHDRARKLRLLDLGVGSGCLVLALLRELPAAEGVGVDRSTTALAVARRNAERLGLSDRLELREGDWATGLAGGFDVIVSNPPYIAEDDIAALSLEASDHEPREALVAGSDGLDAYRRITGELPRLLAPAALVALEVGQGQAAAVDALLQAAGLRPLPPHRDLAGIERCVLARGD